MGRLWRLLRAFGSFWWDFLVGDTPEVLLSALLLVALAFVLSDHRVAATLVLPVAAAALLVASAWRGRRQAGTRRGAGPARGTAVEPADTGEAAP